MIDCSDKIVQIVGIIALTAMGLGAMIIDGSMGEMMMVAVSGAVGVVIGYLFPVGEEKNEVQ